MDICNEVDLLEFDRQRNGVEENIDLEYAEEEEAEMLKHLGKEIPEETDVRGQVRDWETEGREEAAITLKFCKRLADMFKHMTWELGLWSAPFKKQASQLSLQDKLWSEDSIVSCFVERLAVQSSVSPRVKVFFRRQPP